MSPCGPIPASVPASTVTPARAASRRTSGWPFEPLVDRTDVVVRPAGVASETSDHAVDRTRRNPRDPACGDGLHLIESEEAPVLERVEPCLDRVLDHIGEGAMDRVRPPTAWTRAVASVSADAPNVRVKAGARDRRVTYHLRPGAARPRLFRGGVGKVVIGHVARESGKYGPGGAGNRPPVNVLGSPSLGPIPFEL